MAESFLLPDTVKMVAKYKCPDCGNKWKSTNSSGGSKQCKTCRSDFIKPYKMRPMKDKDKMPKRKFGQYDCSCGNHWASGNTWVGKWQKCRDCDAEVMPSHIRPLRGGGGHSNKPHESSLCQRCIELGYTCRDYVPSGDANDIDFPDDLSVMSEASTASSSSWVDEQELSDATPVASDEEGILVDKMKNLFKNN